MICNTCKLELSEEKFPIRIDGNKKRLRKTCKLCLAAWRKNYNDKNKSYYKQYRLDNKEKLKLLDKIYCDKNTNKIRATKRKYIKNRRKNDVNFKLKSLLSVSISKYLKSQNHSKQNISILKYLPYDLERLKNHLESKFEAWMNWNNHGRYIISTWNDNDSFTWTWQIDHIIPHCNFKYTSMKDQEFKKCWDLTNLRPLSSKINIETGNRR